MIRIEKNISKQNGKNNLSGTTSLPNNAIQNVRQLSKVDKHNYRKYDDNQELVEIVRGTSSPLNDAKELYLSEFEEARLEYNSKQTRTSRMIDNYFENVSNNEKKDLACEIILELGDKEYWDTKDENFKKRMSDVYKKQIEKNTENLKQANKKSSELKQNSKDIKDKIDKLKMSRLNKDNYILSKEDKELFIDFINQVNDTSKGYDKIQTLSNTLFNANEQLKDKNKKIKTLTENNQALNLMVKALNETFKEKDNEISFLKSKMQDLKNTIEYLKDKFEKLISFLHDKLHSWYDKDDKYIDVVNEMYDDRVLDDDDIEDLDLSKEKDDYER